MSEKSKYPLIKELGLNLCEVHLNNKSDAWTVPFVKADDIERVLGQGMVLSGYYRGIKGTTYFDNVNPTSERTHTGLVINIKPIKQKLSKDEILHALANFHHDLGGLQDLIDAAKEITK